MHEQEIKRLKTAKLSCESSLLFFTRYMFKARFGSKFIVNWHHVAICDALEKLVNGELGAGNLLINIPPRYGKTEIAVINFPAWCFMRNPSCKFIHTSFSLPLVLDNSSQIRELMKHESYQQLKDIDWKQDSDAKGLWKTDSGGGFLATSSKGTITGFGAGSTGDGCFGKSFAGCIIIDDPLKPDDADSEIERKNVNERLINTIMSRRNNTRETPIVVIMQRLHEDDMSGFILEGATGEKWHHLKIPALSDSGEALWPLKHTAEELNNIKVTSPYMFSGQYMQEPSPPDGEYFKDENVVWYEELPKHMNVYGASDYGVSDNEGDPTEHGVFGLDEHEDLYVIDWWSGQATSDVWIDALLDLVDMHRPIAWGEEKGVILRAVEPLLKKRQRERGIYYNRVGYASTKDKPTRALAIQGRVASRKIYLPKGKPWAVDLYNEMMKFPKGKLDNKVDVLSIVGRMLNGLRGGTVPKEESIPKTAPLTTRQAHGTVFGRVANHDL